MTYSCKYYTAQVTRFWEAQVPFTDLPDPDRIGKIVLKALRNNISELTYHIHTSPIEANYNKLITAFTLYRI